MLDMLDRLCAFVLYLYYCVKKMQYTRPAGPMVRRLTTNQEIAGSTPASVNFFILFLILLLINGILQSDSTKMGEKNLSIILQHSTSASPTRIPVSSFLTKPSSWHRLF